MRKRLVHRYRLNRIRKGDTDSFVRLYDDLAPNIYRFVLFKVNSVEEAEDITSQVFLKMWNYLTDDREEIRSIRAFTYRVARNLIIDYYRLRAQSVQVNVEDHAIVKLSEMTDDTLRTSVELMSDMDTLFEHLQGLKDEYREIILLKHVEELSTKEIGQVLNKNQSAVRTQLSRAMNALKELVSNIDP